MVMQFRITSKKISPAVYEFAAQRGDGLAAQFDAISCEAQVQPAAASRSLVGNNLLFAEARDPVGCEAAVRGAGDGIFIDAEVGIEAARDDVRFVIRAGGGDDNATRVLFAGERGDLLQIRAECANGGLVSQLDQIVEPVAADPDRLRAEYGGETFRRCGWGDGLGGEIQLDPWSAIDNKPVSHK
jgi:hypothetical protein